MLSSHVHRLFLLVVGRIVVVLLLYIVADLPTLPATEAFLLIVLQILPADPHSGLLFDCILGTFRQLIFFVFFYLA